MTLIELLKDIARRLLVPEQDLGRIQFYKPTTLGRAPRTPNNSEV